MKGTVLRNSIIFNSVFLILLSPFFASANRGSNEPPIPYYDNGACPFECCTYRDWTAQKDTKIYKNHDDQSLVVGSVKAGQTVKALTGVVITTEPGKVKIFKAMSLGVENKVSLKAGDVVYYLHYVGEGFDLIWYNGNTYTDQTSFKTDPNTEYWKVLNMPKWVWWVKIELPDGTVGWSREPNRFSNKDACG